MRGLGGVCGASAILQQSYVLPSNFLKIDPDPFASGGYSDVTRGLSTA